MSLERAGAGGVKSGASIMRLVSLIRFCVGLCAWFGTTHIAIEPNQKLNHCLEYLKGFQILGKSPACH